MTETDKNGIIVSGMIIESRPIGDNDRRVVILTKERGKISAFARNARRPRSSLVASTDLFCYGKFRLYAGKDSHTLVEAEIDNYFASFRKDMKSALMGTYFMEILSYITRENNDESQLLLLGYASLRALESRRISAKLIRSIFEIKTVVLEGEFQLPPSGKHSEAVMKALEYISMAPVSRLYAFDLDEPYQRELAALAERYLQHSFNHRFTSLEIIAAMDL